jgi:hypothetical protein
MSKYSNMKATATKSIGIIDKPLQLKICVQSAGQLAGNFAKIELTLIHTDIEKNIQLPTLDKTNIMKMMVAAQNL